MTSRLRGETFTTWAESIDSEVMMAVNLGSRGIDAAGRLVEYCNYRGGTELSDLRRKNGILTRSQGIPAQ